MLRIERPIHFPRTIADPLQSLTRSFLLTFARYNVKIEGQLPSEPSLLLAYPHGEHANSLLLPPTEVSYVAAADHFFQSILSQFLIAFAVDILPITRYNTNREQLYAEILLQQKMLHERGKHVLVYPQGTRKGAAESPEKLQEQLKPGSLLMAQQLQAPVIPVGFVYPEDYQPRKDGQDAWSEFQHAIVRGHLPPKREITVKIGERLHVPSPGSRRDREYFLSETAAELWHLVHGGEPAQPTRRERILKKLHLR